MFFITVIGANFLRMYVRTGADKSSKASFDNVTRVLKLSCQQVMNTVDGY